MGGGWQRPRNRAFPKSYRNSKETGYRGLQLLSAWGLTDCYVETRRIQEAMDLHKSLVADIGKERMLPNCIIGFTATLKRHNGFGCALEVLDEHLDVIASTWDKDKRAKHTAWLGIITVECMTATTQLFITNGNCPSRRRSRIWH